ncbi:MAG: Potassium voltage-gated channel subfamily KQT; possible potassium channel, VIC family [uncultured Pyrinomonadaceae bacterium]|uniref:Potassium voltage-gated channel subfamily KQT possible potassium channel, VIC family n=1 Tax=uncultured Pyrinomonadaceae bacterium TaxID=2283094 RepID=A0A6J4P4D9_9BACT|nr:MAG: Potassium voltage-gated channel subfamily KQT; possible potassium channel, VIC family [uncultured Pyrinomonadaceae bacterium]
MKNEATKPAETKWRHRLYEVIFEAETVAGKTFDVILLIMIILSVAVVILESVKSLRDDYGKLLLGAEWAFTIIFTVEYVLRLISVRRPLRYAKSFFGVIDLLAIIPTYASLFLPGLQYLLAIRILRLLRVFRILKLAEYVGEARVITSALRASAKKISVFLLGVLTLVTIIGSIMYVIEGEQHGFNDIPTSIYWAIVTLTTVGYGDLSPQTPLGKAFASLVMIMGYAIIAVPTGIVTVELSRSHSKISTQVCPECHAQDHDADAVFCKYCATHL